MAHAAAFRCQEGVILCADQELSGRYFKEPEEKLFFRGFPASGMVIAVAFAGTVDWAKMLVDNLFSRLDGLTSEKLHVSKENSIKPWCDQFKRQLFERNTPLMKILFLCQLAC
jgi:hypothetical protein